MQVNKFIFIFIVFLIHLSTNIVGLEFPQPLKLPKDLHIEFGALIKDGMYHGSIVTSDETKRVTNTVRVIIKSLPSEYSRCEQEMRIISIAQQAHHIVRLLARVDSNYLHKSSFVMEYAEHQSLDTTFGNSDTILSMCDKWRIAIQVAEGILGLHDLGIVHGRIESSNILLCKCFHARIANFRSSRIIKNDDEETCVLLKAKDIQAFAKLLQEIFYQKNDDCYVIDESFPQSWEYIIRKCQNDDFKQIPSAPVIVEMLNVSRPPLPAQIWRGRITPNPTNRYSTRLPTEEELEFVHLLYQCTSSQEYEIRGVYVIENQLLQKMFQYEVELLGQRRGNLHHARSYGERSYSPMSDDDRKIISARHKLNEKWNNLSNPYRDPENPYVRMCPLWHGTSRENLRSIAEVGFSPLGYTDNWMMGKGIYLTPQGEYAAAFSIDRVG